MQQTAPSPRVQPKSSADWGAALYCELQEELTAIVSCIQGPYPQEEFVRHAQAGSIKIHDAIILAELIEAQRPARILEVGSFIGFSTRWLLEISRPWSATVTAVDPGVRHRVFDRPDEVLARFNAPFAGRLVQKRGFFSQPMSGDWYYDYEHYQPFVPRPDVDALMRGKPVLTSKNLNEQPFDFVFIDGDHSENAVLSNFTEAVALLNPQGRIAFHDAVTWPDVARALDHIGREYAELGSVEIHGFEFQQPDVNVCDGIGVFTRR